MPSTEILRADVAKTNIGQISATILASPVGVDPPPLSRHGSSEEALMPDREYLVPRSQAELVLEGLAWNEERRKDMGGLSLLQAADDDEAELLSKRLLKLVSKGFERPRPDWDLELLVRPAPTPIPQPEGGARPLGRHAAERRETEPRIGATVAILDTATCPHPWLSGAYVASPASIYDNEDQVVDEKGKPINLASSHATFIAGIIAQQAPNARIIVHKIVDDTNASTTLLGLAEGLLTVGKMGAQVINLSVATTITSEVDYAFPVEVALDGLGPDVPVIAAAGNHGESALRWPAGLSKVVAVGSAGPDPKDGGWVRSATSNYGPWVNLWAPGEAVVSTYIDFPNDNGKNKDRSWAIWDGTSFAAAIVTGRVAAIMETEGVDAWDAVNRLLAVPGRVHLRGKEDEELQLGPLVEPDPRSGLDYKGR
jgi:hypothetical protein